MEKHRNKDGTFSLAGVREAKQNRRLQPFTDLNLDFLSAVSKHNEAMLNCPYHEFEDMPLQESLVAAHLNPDCKIFSRCKHCNGEIDFDRRAWFETGRRQEQERQKP